MSINNILGRCGVYCGQCRNFTTEITELASKLKEFIIQDFSWLIKADVSFNYDNLIKGLEWFSNSKCSGCRNSKESWCDVKKCEKIQNEEIDNCLLCDEFAKCPHTDYQRKRYSYLFEHVGFIKKEGFDSFLEEQERKAKEGVRIQNIRDY